ncbi:MULTISPECIES: sugar ABC transporter substrate-binding protein [unclassified Aureimonas]|uniref:sugar ABC transporter substrate-binding protein n=1 Tax=unclassified Aureimonas TaxID=2615206 RepID=UPI0006F1EAE1|nr:MULTISPECIES: sugar ABC transporter substrate-binding protein [unclassified Aureimonas]KQT64264.1 rhizopine-binding protein [Aureimonas sp. Leaf427]KQT81453.1 rhizopine-binding protein [Aureimonas sp. Leaf460]
MKSSFVIALAAMLASAATPALAETVGVTIARADSTFLTILRNGMEDRAKALSGVTLQVEDAQNDPQRQLDQVRNFIASGVDAIVVAAVDGDGTPAMSKLADEAGIPIVYSVHPPADLDSLPKKAAFVGSDELESGTMQTKEVCKLLGGKGSAYVLMGPLNNHSSIVRTKDIEDVLATPECSGITIVDRQAAGWDRIEAQNIMTNWLSSSAEFDAVIANNDEMAIGAIQALKAVDRDMKSVVIAGIDATPDGLSAMKAGELDVTVFQNATQQGAASVDAALSLARGEATEPKIWVPFELVTPANIASYDTSK